jgi:hypothetical protein
MPLIDLTGEEVAQTAAAADLRNYAKQLRIYRMQTSADNAVRHAQHLEAIVRRARKKAAA